MIHLGVLGPLVVETPDGTLALRAPLQRRIVALLVLHASAGRQAHRDQLIDQLWDGTPPRSASSALAVHVSQLRKTGLREVIVTTPTGYVLADDGVTIDVADFEHNVRRGVADEMAGRAQSAQGFLDDALGAWRGRPYEDLRYHDASQAAIGQLQRLRRSALLARGAACLAVGDHVRATADADLLLAEDPADTQAWRLLARCHHDLAGPEAAGEIVRRARAAGVELEHAAGPTAGGTARPVRVALEPTAPPPLPEPFVGRTGDVRQILDSLTGSRLVSLVGPGGVGKTAVAAAVGRGHRGPVAWTSLSQVTPDAVPAAVATQLGIRTGDIAGVARSLGGARLLLVLDTCEHVREAVTVMVDALLPRCPGLTVLATTRQVLGARGEQIIPVRPLPTGVDGAAARLFGALAARQDPTIDLPQRQVADLCRRLDGLPLALEIAAAHVGALGIDGLRDMLGRGDTLPALPGAGPPRTRTLMAAVGWSYRLLDPEAARALRRLSMVAEPFDQRLAAALGVDPDQLATLVLASLLAAQRSPDGTRYRMLDTVRAFGRAATTEQDEPDEAVRLLADAMDADLVAAHEGTAVTVCRRLLEDDDAARGAGVARLLADRWVTGSPPPGAPALLRMAAASTSDGEVASRLLAASGRIAAMRNEVAAALADWDAALERCPTVLPRAELHRRRGELLMEANRQTAAEAAFEAAEDATGRLGPATTDADQRAWVDVALARCLFAYRRFDLPAQRDLLDRVTPVATNVGTPRQRITVEIRRFHADLQQERYAPPAEWVVRLEEDRRAAERSGHPAALASAWFRTGFFHVLRTEPDDALAALAEAEAINRSIGRVSVHVHVYRVTALRLTGDDAEVERLGTPAADLADEHGASEYVGLVQGSQAWLEWRRGDMERTAGLAERALQRWRHHPHPYPLQWTALLPLIAARHAQGHQDGVMDAAQQLLQWPQQRLPGPVAELVTATGDDPEAVPDLLAVASSHRLL